jgi:hypothetical protein
MDAAQANETDQERLGRLYAQVSDLVKEHGLEDVEFIFKTLAEDERSQ